MWTKFYDVYCVNAVCYTAFTARPAVAGKSFVFNYFLYFQIWHAYINVLANNTKAKTLHSLSLQSNPAIKPFLFSIISRAEITKHVLSNKSDATGFDNIDRQMMLLISCKIRYKLTKITCYSINPLSARLMHWYTILCM